MENSHAFIIPLHLKSLKRAQFYSLFNSNSSLFKDHFLLYISEFCRSVERQAQGAVGDMIVHSNFANKASVTVRKSMQLIQVYISCFYLVPVAKFSTQSTFK